MLLGMVRVMNDAVYARPLTLVAWLELISNRGSGHNVGLLSPANTSAIRGQLLLNRNSEFELAQRIRRHGASLGELFSFISSLYFRGKLAYAEAFSNSPTGFRATLVMTTSRGLLPPETIITLDDLLEMSAVPIDPGDARYRKPLCRDARALARVLPAGSQIVLLGSIASGKYVDPLLEIFGANLLFPQQFVGRGDMSRGGLGNCNFLGSRRIAWVRTAGEQLRGKHIQD